MQFQNHITVLPVAFLRLFDRNQVEGRRLWRFCAAQRLHRDTFSKPSLPVSSAYFLQPCAKHSMNHPASAPSPAKWIPDAQSRPWTKWGRKTLLRQISRENAIRESKQTWRGGGQAKHPGAHLQHIPRSPSKTVLSQWGPYGSPHPAKEGSEHSKSRQPLCQGLRKWGEVSLLVFHPNVSRKDVGPVAAVKT